MSTEKKENNLALLDKKVSVALATGAMNGFQRAHTIAVAIKDIRAMLTPEFMEPIMALQGSKLGFRTDRDKNRDGTKGPGYPMDVVRDCLIDATLIGLEPYGNQFNIIGGNMYPTKEGIGALLDKIPDLYKDFQPGTPKINADKTSGVIQILVEWKRGNEALNKKELNYPIQMGPYVSLDSAIGKATRKARKWLLEKVTGLEFTEAGETQDINAEDVTAKSGQDTTSAADLNSKIKGAGKEKQGDLDKPLI